MAVTRVDLGPLLRRVAERVERQLGEVTTTHIPAVGRVDLERLAIATLDDAELSRLGSAPAPVTACPLFLPSLLHPGAGIPTPQLRADGLDPRDAPGTDEADQVAVMHGGGAITFTGEVVEGGRYEARRRIIAVEPKGSAARPFIRITVATTFRAVDGEDVAEYREFLLLRAVTG